MQAMAGIVYPEATVSCGEGLCPGAVKGGTQGTYVRPHDAPRQHVTLYENREIKVSKVDVSPEQQEK